MYLTRRYCGELGKQDNCQVAVSVSLATATASVPVAWRFYLPQEWADDAERRERAGVPRDIPFATKPEIALSQIQEARATGVPIGTVLADAAYGTNTAWRDALVDMDLRYVVGVVSSVGVWASPQRPTPPPPWSGKGRPPVRHRRTTEPVASQTDVPLKRNGTYFSRSASGAARKCLGLKAEGSWLTQGSIGWLCSTHPDHRSEGQPAWIVMSEALCSNVATTSHAVPTRPKRWSSSTC
jgi:SRSO17 transposase